MKLNREEGTVLGLIAVPEAHSVSPANQGEPIPGVGPNRIFLYQKNAQH